MVDKDRYNMRKLPEGMTYASIRAELERAYAILRKSDDMTDDIEAVLRYVSRLVIDAELDDFHSNIPQNPPESEA